MLEFQCPIAEKPNKVDEHFTVEFFLFILWNNGLLKTSLLQTGVKVVKLVIENVLVWEYKWFDIITVQSKKNNQTRHTFLYKCIEKKNRKETEIKDHSLNADEQDRESNQVPPIPLCVRVWLRNYTQKKRRTRKKKHLWKYKKRKTTNNIKQEYKTINKKKI